MGAKSRRKGYRIEAEVVQRCRDLGLDARRVPLSGAAPGWAGDLEVNGMRGEVKGRANGGSFKTIEKWLGANDLLFLRRDRADPLVLLPWSTWAKLMGKEG